MQRYESPPPQGVVHSVASTMPLRFTSRAPTSVGTAPSKARAVRLDFSVSASEQPRRQALLECTRLYSSNDLNRGRPVVTGLSTGSVASLRTDIERAPNTRSHSLRDLLCNAGTSQGDNLHSSGVTAG
jgi:hypothetical protein